jgi:hypothetical protein
VRGPSLWTPAASPCRAALEYPMRHFARGSASRRNDQPADNLDELMNKISYGSREAFAALYDRTSGTVRAHLEARLPDRDWVDAVLAATYVEVWWLAGCRTGPYAGVVVWLEEIAERRVAESSVAAGRTVLPSPMPDAVVARSRYALMELAELLARPVPRI